MITLASFSESFDDPNIPYDRLGASYLYGIGESFTPSQNKPWAGAGFYICKVGSPTGNAYAKLYTAQDDGDGYYPVTLLATSDAVDVSTLGTSKAIKDFLTSVGEQYSLNSAVTYVVTLEYSGGDASNYIRFGMDGQARYDYGNMSYNDADWYGTIEDLIFRVYGVETTTEVDVTKALAYRVTTEHSIEKPLHYQVGPILIDSYSESNSSASYQVGDNHPDKRVGQSFANTIAIILDSCKFYLRKNNSPTGNIYVYLYAHTGTYGSGGKPTGAILATSDGVDSASLSTSLALVNFNFSGANRVVLSANTKYCLVIRHQGGDLGVNSISYGIDGTSPTHGGNYFYSTDGSSFIASTEDLPFYVYGSPLPAEVDTTKALAYRVISEHDVTKALAYRALTDHDITKALAYEISNTTTTDIEKALAYYIKIETDTSKSLAYRVETTPESIYKALAYRVQTTPADIEKALSYAIKTIGSVTKALSYTVIAEQAITKGLTYEIDNTIYNTYDSPALYNDNRLLYDGLAVKIDITVGLEYRIKTVESLTKSLAYKILNTNDNDKDLVYKVIKSNDSLQKSLEYYIVGERTPISKTLQYCILTNSLSVKNLNYKIQAYNGINKILSYTIITPAEITKTLHYVVDVAAHHEITKSIEYVLAVNPYCQQSNKYSTQDKYEAQESKYTPDTDNYSQWPRRC